MVIRSLQFGRAVAAIAVAAFHLSIMMGMDRYGASGAFREYTSSWNRGVDFFFVLSGFIILFAHHRDIGRPNAWLNYAQRRFVRLFPIYWLYSALFVCAFALIGANDATLPQSINDWATSITLIRFTDASPPLSVAWTLFHELAFYAVFSILIFNKRSGVIALLLFVLISVATFHFPAEHSRNPLSVYTSAYNIHFVIGMGAFWLFQRRGSGGGSLQLACCC